MRVVLTTLDRIAEALAFIAGATLFVLMAMTFTDVVLRSVFNAPLEAAAELTRIFMAVIVFTVLPVVSAKGDHISVDLMDPLFGPWASRLRDGLVSLLCGVALLWPAERIMVLAERARSYGDVTEFLHIPDFYAGWMIAIFTGLAAVALALRGLAILIWGGAGRD